MVIRRLPLLLAGAALALAGTAVPAAAGSTAVAAAPTVGAPATVVPAGCDFERASADAAAAGTTSRGFVAFAGGTCTDDGVEGRLVHFSGSGTGWTRERSPYTGHVMAVTTDATGTYVLYASSSGTHLGKWRTTGGFAAPVRLSTRGLTGAVIPEGDVVALAGQYWAVWTEQVGPSFEFAPIDLFQAKTIGAGHCVDAITRQRITAHSRDDTSPSLTLVPATSGRSGARLLWSRNDGAVGESGWAMYARAGCDGRWTSQTLAAVGNNLSTDMTRSGTADHLAWERGNRLVQATVRPSGHASRTFSTPPASQPRIAASADRVLVAFVSGGRLAVQVHDRGAWSLGYLTAAGLQQQLVAATAATSRFTVFGASPSSDRLYAVGVS